MPRPCDRDAVRPGVDRPQSSSCAACPASCRPRAASAWRSSCEERRDAARARTVSAAWLWLCSFAGTDRTRRGGVLRHTQKNPGWRGHAGKHRRRSRRTSCMGEPTRRVASQCAMIVAGARQNREGNAASEFQPAAPARQLLQNVGAHQPDEVRAWKPPQQAAQRIDGVARAEHRLDRAGDDAASVGDACARRPDAGRTAPCRVAASADCPARPAARPDRAAAACAPTSMIWRCPACAGLNEPPSRPMRMRRRSPNRGSGSCEIGAFRDAPARCRSPDSGRS